VAYLLLLKKQMPDQPNTFPRSWESKTLIRNGTKSRLGGIPVLVAEKEPIARTSLSELFRDAGHSVLEAADSMAAIGEINNNAGLRVIMLDVEMPSWRSVVTHARRMVPRAFILGMSAQDSSRSVLEAQGLGVHAYFLKPLVFDEVYERISRFVMTSPMRRVPT
jgi:DNA-binding response OmpR family regulator